MCKILCRRDFKKLLTTSFRFCLLFVTISILTLYQVTCYNKIYCGIYGTKIDFGIDKGMQHMFGRCIVGTYLYFHW